ncbi:hypothetical protein TOK_4643 [Pseudonocardia sp. N23]|nr:hypothetical protein TOK_4643 [Pseudonocardia sp. N23]
MAVVEQLPSCGPDAETVTDTASDLRTAGETIASLDGPVVLVGRSSGGMAITERADRPRVGHTVYVAADWPERGQSVLDLLGGGMPLWLELLDDGTAQVVDDLDVRWKTLCAGSRGVARDAPDRLTSGRPHRR